MMLSRAYRKQFLSMALIGCAVGLWGLGVEAQTEELPPVSLPQTAAMPAAQAVTQPAAAAPAPAATVDAAAHAQPEKKKPEKVAFNPAKGEWIGSIMFSITDLRQLNEVLEAYELRKKMLSENGTNGEDGRQSEDFLTGILSSLREGVDPNAIDAPEPQNLVKDKNGNMVPMPEALPSIYVNSIMYISPQNWMIWLNNQQFTPENPPHGKDYSLVDVTNDSITLLWNNEFLDTMVPDWQAKSVVKGSAQRPNRYDRSDRRNSNVVVDPREGEVYITLRPNQTLVGDRLEIIEGKFSSGMASLNDGPVPVAVPQQPQKEEPEKAEAITPVDIEKENAKRAMGVYSDFTEEFIKHGQSPKERIKQSLNLENDTQQ